jgi:T4 RnlA family RNA ligase
LFSYASESWQLEENKVYKFPHITHIDQVLAAIAGRDEFVVKVDADNDYTVVNYLVNFEDTFPPVIDERTAILRECRGITFRTSTGQVIARKYHKFFNLGERPETMPENIDWTRKRRKMEKLDGSMITPLETKGEIHWCTKMGMTGVAAPIDVWAEDKPHYEAFARHWMGQNKTPIFEWCSRMQRIVIDYVETRLVLTAIRDNVTGAYEPYEALVAAGAAHGIPVVKASDPIEGISDAEIAEIRAIEGEEGEVWAFEGDDERLKLKGEWYSILHKTLDHLNHEKDVIRLILDEKLDDAKPFLPEDLVKAADDFAHSIYNGLRARASTLYWEVQADYDNMNGGKKKFADKIVRNEDKVLNGIKFWMWDHIQDGETGLYEYLVAFVQKQLGTQTKVNGVRYLWGGTQWASFRDAPKEE